jgi:hypothetical protein
LISISLNFTSTPVYPRGFGRALKDRISLLEWEIDQAEKAGFPHFMQKEICEQPRVVEDSIRCRLIEEEGLGKAWRLRGGREEAGKDREADHNRLWNHLLCRLGGWVYV